MGIFTDFSGGDFLFFYAVMLATAVLAGVFIPAFLREAGGGGVPDDMEEIAVLAGGAERHANAVLSSLFAKDALGEGEKRKLRVIRTEVGDGETERSILRKVGDFSVKEARATLKEHAERIEQRLIRRGLMLDGSGRWQLRLLSILPYVAVFVIGLYRQRAGAAEGEPTGLLILLLVATAFLVLMRLLIFNPRTMAGNAALKAIEGRSSRLKRAPQPAEAGFAVALFGTAVLVGTPWEPIHAAQRAGGSGDAGFGGDSDSDSGDGGGGCGGGCGGCGG